MPNQFKERRSHGKHHSSSSEEKRNQFKSDRSDRNHPQENENSSHSLQSKTQTTNGTSEETVEEPYEVKEIDHWDELKIDPAILRGIYAYGFENPSPIQRKAILPILSGKDMIAQAQSGTGKTATFAIGSLSILNLNTPPKTQVIILSPTRELTIQTASVVNSIGSMLQNLVVQTLYGGSSVDENINQLKTNTPHIICGCPGRVYDMIRRNKIHVSTVKLVILDEADEMLSQGFKEQVYHIFSSLKNDIQIALFSATLPSNIYQMTQKFMRNPVTITVKTEQLTLEGISQYFVAMDNDVQKYETLKDLYSHISLSQCIIYVNSVKRVEDLKDAMMDDGFPVTCIHSNMDRITREQSFLEFRNGKSRVLISSNVTSRGIDIQQVSTVINFDIPNDIHNYLHRIGRSGRWGRKGVGINFITRRDVQKLKEIEQYYSCEIKELPADLSILQN